MGQSAPSLVPRGTGRSLHRRVCPVRTLHRHQDASETTATATDFSVHVSRAPNQALFIKTEGASTTSSSQRGNVGMWRTSARVLRSDSSTSLHAAATPYACGAPLESPICRRLWSAVGPDHLSWVPQPHVRGTRTRQFPNLHPCSSPCS